MNRKAKKSPSVANNGCDEDYLRILSSCVEQSSEGICVADLDGKIIFVNKAAANMHGFEPDELIGENIAIFHTPEQLQQVKKAVMIGKQTGSFYGELWHKHRDGHVFSSIMANSLLRDESGNVVGLIGTMRDITDIKEVENALRQSEHHFRTIFQTVPDAISITRLEDGLYIDCNEVFLTKTGYTRDELIGHSSLELDIWDNPADRQRLVSGLKKNGRVDNLEAVFHNKHGERIRGLMSARIIELQGEPFLISVTHDITDRIAEQEALRESEEKFRGLAESTGAAIFIFQGEHNVYANPAAQTMTGYSEKEIRTMRFWDLIHPDYREIVRERGLARQKAENVPRNYEVKLITKSGDIRCLEFTGAQITFQGKPAVLGTAFDITARKEAQEKLRQATKELEKEHLALTEKNVALKQILDHIEQERLDYKDSICAQIDAVTRPVIHRLKELTPESSHAELEQLESSLEGILGKDVDIFRDNYRKLTPREIEICELIKQGNSSKQISASLNLSLLTVHKHREQIRDKLGLTHKNINLSSFLRAH